MIKSIQIQKRFSHNRSKNEKKRLSCEELESLKERFVDFIDSNDLPPPPDCRQLSRLSMSSESADSSISLSKPEPPVRTVSIRNMDDTISIKSVYSSCRNSLSNQVSVVQASRSVFSIYEEEDENLSMTTSSSTHSSSSRNRLERLSDFEMEKIESLYKSIGCVVSVSQSTCDLYTTTSEQIADSLNNCWRILYTAIVPVLVFDTGSNPKRDKQLRLVFVDKSSGLPISRELIQIDRSNFLRHPNIKEKCLTFRLNELICLLKFYDYYSCTEFFSFYSDVSERNADMSMSQAKSMSSLNKQILDKTKRHSDFVSVANLNKSGKKSARYVAISKHCISNPCAFQHVNSIKNDNFTIRNILDNFNMPPNHLLLSLESNKKNVKN